ncbi:SAM-dependent methyltransferase [bacterium 1XD8-76]|nr:SAM-dependent methyltransferase [bacterium 1XD8-76]
MITEKIHNRFIYSRRMERLADIFLKYIPNDCKSILDVGCGDGKIDSVLMTQNPSLSIKGIDVLIRDKVYIAVSEYDGHNIPMQDSSVDIVMLIDVLHHTDDPEALLKEVTRVAGKYVIIKDHVKSGMISYFKLRLMDYVGNAHYHVRLPYNYLSIKKWKEIFNACGLKNEEHTRDLNLYSGINHLLFDSNLHFVARLRVSGGEVNND